MAAKIRFGVAVIIVANLAVSQSEAANDIANLTVENDLFIGKDNGYTNGAYLSWAHGPVPDFTPDNLPTWLYNLSKLLPISTMPDKQRGVSYLIGQSMQTPSDLSEKELIVEDPPYLGMLIWQTSLHAYGQQVADTLSLSLGLVGPAAGAEATQKLGHKLLDSEEPKGWSNQIHNEPCFRISTERLWRLADMPVHGNFGFDVIGIGSAGVGTIKSNVATGFSIRFGRDLERSFPTATMLPGREVHPLAGELAHSWRVFFNVLGEYVANDITIDGNTFRDSHSVPLQHWQAQAALGAALNLQQWAFMLSFVKASDRYENQREGGDFGALSISYTF
ncbi:MAG: lipid A deacylase LpxR family protein [Spongiibacteraceae bacterium]